MIQSISITIMILLFLFGASIAMLAEAFNKFMQPGHIFNWWHNWLEKIARKASEERQILKRSPRKIYSWEITVGWQTVKAKWYYRLIAKISKPLGLCPYCNSTWIAITFFIIYFGINWSIFLLIGIVWFFIDIIEQRKKTL